MCANYFVTLYNDDVPVEFVYLIFIKIPEHYTESQHKMFIYMQL